ncbi:DNA repair protein, partial [Pseudomonas monteilii]|nr:DNA repair protein [Pseudomonas monteilii]
LVRAGKLMSIELLDHIIVGSDDYYSYREEGKL